MTRALLLNASMEPLNVVPDRRAVRLYMFEKADVIEYSGNEFHSANLVIMVPSVLRLRKYVVLPDEHRTVALITKNVLARDNYVCAYCGGVADTMDHIVPRALGGPHAWENVTAACGKCNHAKGNRTLAQMGWTLERTPYRPHGVAERLRQLRPPPEWMPYLQTTGAL